MRDENPLNTPGAGDGGPSPTAAAAPDKTPPPELTGPPPPPPAVAPDAPPPVPYAADIARHLERVGASAGDPREVRVLTPAPDWLRERDPTAVTRAVSVRADDPARFAEVMARQADRPGVIASWVVPSPLRGDLGYKECVKRGDVTGWPAVVLDIDPDKGPSAAEAKDDARGPGCLATPYECAEAGAAAWALWAWLRDRGCPLPLWVYSGSGHQLSLRCGLTLADGDAEVRAAVAWFARAARAALGSGGALAVAAGRAEGYAASLDTGPVRPEACTRLAGVPNRKGSHRPDLGRPWRTARILADPGDLECVPPAKWAEWAAELDPDGTHRADPAKAGRSGGVAGDPAAAGEGYGGTPEPHILALAESVVAVCVDNGCELLAEGTDPCGRRWYRVKCPKGCGGDRMIFADAAGVNTACLHSDTPRPEPGWTLNPTAPRTTCKAWGWSGLKQCCLGPSLRWEADDERDERVRDAAELAEAGAEVARLLAGKARNPDDLGGDAVDDKPDAGDGDGATAGDAGESRTPPAAPPPPGPPPAAPPPPGPPPAADPDRRVVKLTDRDEAEVNADFAGAVAAANRPVRHVILGNVPARIARGGDGGGVKAVPLDRGGVRALLSESARPRVARRANGGKRRGCRQKCRPRRWKSFGHARPGCPRATAGSRPPRCSCPPPAAGTGWRRPTGTTPGAGAIWTSPGGRRTSASPATRRPPRSPPPVTGWPIWCATSRSCPTPTGPGSFPCC